MTEDPDWRTAAYSRAQEDALHPNGDVDIPAGTLLTVINIGHDYRGSLVQFGQPSAAALALNIARKAGEEALRLQSTLVFKPAGTFASVPVSDVSLDQLPILFECLESCLICAMFSFQALESYANMILDHNIRTTYPWPDKNGEHVQQPVGWLERHLTTEEKLGILVPKVLNMTSPKGKKVWENFKSLQKVRNAAVHVKGADQTVRSQHPDDLKKGTLFSSFLNAPVMEWPKSAVTLINYYDRRDVQWPWVQHELDRYGIPRNDKS